MTMQGVEGDAGARPAPPNGGAPEASPPWPSVPPLAEALDRLEQTLASPSNRDAVAAALLEFCAPHAARCALFAVASEGIRGVAGRGRGFDTEILRQICVSENTGTVFDTALRSRGFFFGSVPPLPANRDLYTVLGGKLPKTALLLPVRVRGKTAALLYLDGDERPMTGPDISTMRRVAAKAGLALEILLLRSKLRGI